MLNLGQKLPIATLSKQKKIQNDPVGRLGVINYSILHNWPIFLNVCPYFGNQR